jgi:hypothetical protein
MQHDRLQPQAVGTVLPCLAKGGERLFEVTLYRESPSFVEGEFLRYPGIPVQRCRPPDPIESLPGLSRADETWLRAASMYTS